MKNLVKGTLFIAVAIITVIFINAATTTSPSGLLHSEKIQKQDMLEAKAERVFHELIQDDSLTEVNTAMNDVVGLSWKISAVEGDEVVKITIILEDTLEQSKIKLMGMNMDKNIHGKTTRFSYFY
ncbi:MAG: hypothetical protein WD335_01025 [Candidatus Paceibacterota bacterium]